MFAHGGCCVMFEQVRIVTLLELARLPNEIVTRFASPWSPLISLGRHRPPRRAARGGQRSNTDRYIWSTFTFLSERNEAGS
jgi:hypothetical protein